MFIFIFVVSKSVIFVPQCCSSFTGIEEYEHDSNFLWVLSIFVENVSCVVSDDHEVLSMVSKQ